MAHSGIFRKCVSLGGHFIYGDKKISLEDAPDPVRQRLDQFDANKDGFIEPSEIDQMMRR